MSQSTADVFANLPPLDPNLGNKIWEGAGKGLDYMMNLIIEEGGKLLGAGVMLAANTATGVGAAVVDKAASIAEAATPSFTPDFTPFKGNQIESPNVPQRQIAMSSPGMEELGNLVPSASLPSKVRGGQSIGLAA